MMQERACGLVMGHAAYLTDQYDMISRRYLLHEIRCEDRPCALQNRQAIVRLEQILQCVVASSRKVHGMGLHILREDTDGKPASMADPRQKRGTRTNTDTNQGWVERDRHESADRHAVIALFCAGRHNRDAGRELPTAGAQGFRIKAGLSLDVWTGLQGGFCHDFCRIFV